MLMGHSGGTAMALALAYALQNTSVQVQGLVLGAAFNQNSLPAAAQQSAIQALQNMPNDELWQKVISGLGTPQPQSQAQQNTLVQNFRHDALMALQLMQQLQQKPKLSAPIHTLFGQQDPATPQFEQQYKTWGQYTAQLSMQSLPNANHFFVGQQAAATAQAIHQLLTKWQLKGANAPT